MPSYLAQELWGLLSLPSFPSKEIWDFRGSYYMLSFMRSSRVWAQVLSKHFYAPSHHLSSPLSLIFDRALLCSPCLPWTHGLASAYWALGLYSPHFFFLNVFITRNSSISRSFPGHSLCQACCLRSLLDFKICSCSHDSFSRVSYVYFKIVSTPNKN